MLSGTPTNTEVGTHNVVLRVNDGTVDVDQSFTITVSNTNDPPTIFGTKLDQAVNDNASHSPFTNVIISDVDNPAQILTVVISLDSMVKGQFTTLNGFTDNLDGSYSFSGTAADVTTAIRGLVYDPTDNRVDVGNFELTFMDISVDDGFGPVFDNVTSVVAQSINDNPTATNDNLGAIDEEGALTITTLTELLANDSDPDTSMVLTLASFTQPANGTLVDNGDGTLIYIPDSNFSGTDSFDYTITDGDGGSATGKAFIIVSPVGDTPAVTNVATTAGIQSGLIVVSRNANDGAEVSHFRISGITNGTLYLADGTTEVENGDFITVAQGQAGLRFTPEVVSAGDGSFRIESSEDGVTVAGQSGVAVASIRIDTTPGDPDSPTEDPDDGGEEEETGEPDENADEDEGPAVVIADEPPTPETLAADDGQVSLSLSSVAKTYSRLENNNFFSDFDRLFSGESSTTDKIKILIDKVSYANLVKAFEDLEIPTLTKESYQLVHQALDAIQEEIEASSKVENAIIASTIATSVGLSAGYVVWLLQGGTLLTSVLATMPAWQLTDPLSILAGHREDEDEESLQNIIEEGSTDDEDELQEEPGV